MLATRLAMNQSRSFGKTNHNKLPANHLRLLLRQKELKHSLKVRALLNRSKAALKSAKAKSAENLLTGKARLMVKDLLKLQKSGKIAEKEVRPSFCYAPMINGSRFHRMSFHLCRLGFACRRSYYTLPP
jgi:hypothetical protein